jgi:hypothetical protein
LFPYLNRLTSVNSTCKLCHSINALRYFDYKPLQTTTLARAKGTERMER